MVFLPYDAIGYDPSRHSAHIPISLDSPKGHILTDAMKGFAGQLDRMRHSDGPALAAGFSESGSWDCSWTMGKKRRTTVTSGRHAEPQCSVSSNARLHEPGLGLAHLVKAFGASRATIYRGLRRIRWPSNALYSNAASSVPVSNSAHQCGNALVGSVRSRKPGVFRRSATFISYFAIASAAHSGDVVGKTTPAQGTHRSPGKPCLSLRIIAR